MRLDEVLEGADAEVIIIPELADPRHVAVVEFALRIGNLPWLSLWHPCHLVSPSE